MARQRSLIFRFELQNTLHRLLAESRGVARERCFAGAFYAREPPIERLDQLTQVSKHA